MSENFRRGFTFDGATGMHTGADLEDLVTQADYAPGSGALDQVTLEDDGNGKARVKDGGIDTAQLADDAVTNDKLADDAVQEANLADGAVNFGTWTAITPPALIDVATPYIVQPSTTKAGLLLFTFKNYNWAFFSGLNFWLSSDGVTYTQVGQAQIPFLSSSGFASMCVCVPVPKGYYFKATQNDSGDPKSERSIPIYIYFMPLGS